MAISFITQAITTESPYYLSVFLSNGYRYNVAPLFNNPVLTPKAADLRSDRLRRTNVTDRRLRDV